MLLKLTLGAANLMKQQNFGADPQTHPNGSIARGFEGPVLGQLC